MTDDEHLNEGFAGITDDEWREYCRKFLHPVMHKARCDPAYQLPDVLNELTINDAPEKVRYLLVFTAAINLQNTGMIDLNLRDAGMI